MRLIARLLFVGAMILFARLGANKIIAVNGNLSGTLNASALQGGSGTDLIESYECAPSGITLDIMGTTGPSDLWRVDVKRIDGDFHGDFNLYIRRSSDGYGAGPISGGASYQEVTSIDQAFFDGGGDRSDINVEFRLSGISVRVPVSTYATTVYYTVIDFY